MADTLANLENLKKMKVADLKKELAKLGLSTKGLKPELLQRLEQHMHEQAEEDALIGNGANDELNGEAGGDDAGDDNEETGVLQDKDSGDHSLGSKSVTHVSTETAGVVTAEERRLARAKRFGGDISTKDKKVARAIRFGISQAAGGNTLLPDKMKQRAERFGTENKSSSVAQSNVDERIKKRQERFGIVVSSVKSSASKYKIDNSNKLKRRLEKFGSVGSVGSPELEAKKKKRAERFGNL
ncbi:SAP domain-containing ribonucleoprotein-like isoform X2 [Corticium candelabrum]|uniref:SAP domain-containing ribonucleoprotein-like isoform X2 n=1 Tax=Corticium candelabrum TaxID=121492 RepID=UPI002E26F1FB|nr:SAP domain-containing ribonucleoprotein-like isoform X2 [Corticium candelabrum]